MSLQWELSRARVDFRRSLNGAKPVDLTDMPDWFAWALCRACGLLPSSSNACEARSEFGGHSFFDHCGSCDDGRLFVTEPYAYGRDDRMELFAEAFKVAEAIGCHVEILEPDLSWWNPGETWRIEFSQSGPVCAGTPTGSPVATHALERCNDDPTG